MRVGCHDNIKVTLEFPMKDHRTNKEEMTVGNHELGQEMLHIVKQLPGWLWDILKNNIQK